MLSLEEVDELELSSEDDEELLDELELDDELLLLPPQFDPGVQVMVFTFAEPPHELHQDAYDDHQALPKPFGGELQSKAQLAPAHRNAASATTIQMIVLCRVINTSSTDPNNIPAHRRFQTMSRERAK